jgi:hypothetical protein
MTTANSLVDGYQVFDFVVKTLLDVDQSITIG